MRTKNPKKAYKTYKKSPQENKWKNHTSGNNYPLKAWKITIKLGDPKVLVNSKAWKFSPTFFRQKAQLTEASTTTTWDDRDTLVWPLWIKGNWRCPAHLDWAHLFFSSLPFFFPLSSIFKLCALPKNTGFLMLFSQGRPSWSKSSGCYTGIF